MSDKPSTEGSGKLILHRPRPPQITQENECPRVSSKMWFFSLCAEILRLIFKSVHKGHNPKSKIKDLGLFARPQCGHTICAFPKRGPVLQTVAGQAEVRLLGVSLPRLGRHGQSRARGHRLEPHSATGHPTAELRGSDGTVP